MLVEFPAVEAKVDPPLNIEGEWVLDIKLGESKKWVVVQWWPKTEKFGVSDCSDSAPPFSGPDKVCDDLLGTLAEIRELLQQ